MKLRKALALGLAAILTFSLEDAEAMPITQQRRFTG